MSQITQGKKVLNASAKISQGVIGQIKPPFPTSVPKKALRGYHNYNNHNNTNHSNHSIQYLSYSNFQPYPQYFQYQPFYGQYGYPHYPQQNQQQYNYTYNYPTYMKDKPLRNDEVLPKIADVGMVAEFKVSQFEFRLGIVTSIKKKSNGRRTKYVIAEKYNSLNEDFEVIHNRQVKEHVVSERDISFLFPLKHKSNVYQFRVNDLPDLLDQCQAEVEKYRYNMEIIYGSWKDSNMKTISVASVAKFIFGDFPKPHEYYISHRLLQESRIYFRQSSLHKYELLSLSEVEEEKKKIRNNKEDIELKRFLHRFNNKLSQIRGESSKSELISFDKDSFNDNLVWNPSQDYMFVDQLKDYALSTYAHPPSESVYKKLLKPLNVGQNPKDLFSILVNIGVLSKNENPHSVRFSQNLEFTPNELKVYNQKAVSMTHEINSILSLSNCVSMLPPQLDRDSQLRRDLRGLGTSYAIDSDPSSSEIDDAIGLIRKEDGSQCIVIHISDPSRIVNPNDDLDMIARKRCQSTFLPEKTYTMFPPSFSRHHFSLLPGKNNFALTYIIKLDDEGDIEHYEIFPSMIDSVQSLTYDAADSIIEEIENGTTQLNLTPLQIDLRDLLMISKKRHGFRVKRGALFLDTPRPNIVIDENSDDVDIIPMKEYESYSRKVVRELMILVGEVTAKYSKENMIPIPFRSQGRRSSLSNNNNETQPFVTKGISPSTITLQMQNMMNLFPAQNEVRGLPHMGLAVNEYCQSTSPIRRYLDLIIHQQIKSHMRGEGLPYTSYELMDMITQLQSMQSQLLQLELKSKKFWILKYFEKQSPTKTYVALSCGSSKIMSGSLYITVWLLDIGWKTDIKFHREAKYGEVINLIIEKVDSFNEILIFTEKSTHKEDNNKSHITSFMSV